MNEGKTRQITSKQHLEFLNWHSLKSMSSLGFLFASSIWTDHKFLHQFQCCVFLHSRYHQLDQTKSLCENLQGKNFIEYPTLHIVLPDRDDQYPLSTPKWLDVKVKRNWYMYTCNTCTINWQMCILRCDIT